MNQNYSSLKTRVMFLCALMMLSIITFAQAPTSLQYPAVSTFKVNVDNAYLAPTVAGNVTGYSITPALPAGMSFSTSTGIISGTPTAATVPTDYTVTASNASGSANFTLNIQTYNLYYNNANGQVSFLAANAVPKVTNGAVSGQTAGDIVLYTNVTNIGGTNIDCIVTTKTVTGVSSWNAYDQAAVSGSNFNSNSDNFFSPQVTYSAGGGSMTFDFQFILGGSYNNVTNKGNNLILQSVKVNTYDIDGNGTAIQFNEFGGFSSSELGSPTNEVVTYNATTGLTRFTSNTAANTATVTDPANRIRVTYSELSNFDITVGADNSGLAYFFLDFSAGAVFTSTTTSAPSLDLNTTVAGVNNSNSGCGSAINFTGGAGQTNAASPTNLNDFTVSFPTANILNGVDEKLLISGATSGGTIALNFANGAAIPNVVFGTTITYAVAATVSGGVSTLTFTRSAGTSQFTLARAEELADAMQYQNVNGTPTNGSRSFTLNIRNTQYKSPDAIFTATLNCVGISGNIYHDANGLTDNTVNPNSTTGQFANSSMYAVLVDPSNDHVLKTQAITSGAYNFGNNTAGKYLIYFSNNTPPAVGATYTSSTFPSGGYISTGENLGAAAGSDQLADGKLITTVGSISVTNANFGLQIPPTATGTPQGSSLNPGGFNFKTITGSNFGAADADGTVSSITITSFPTNTNDLKIGSTVYVNGGSCPPQSSCTAWPGSVTIPFSGGVPASSISVDPIDGATTVTISYISTDNGNASSTSSAVTVPFTVPGATLSIAGNVWNDANGDALINGAEALTNVAGSGETLRALLIQTTNTYSGQPTIYSTVPVSASTGYLFPDVPAGNDYRLRIISVSSAPTDGSAETTVSAALAPGYTGVSTNNSGTPTTGLVTNDLQILASAFAASKVNVNFGIERRPVANNASHVIPQPSYGTSKSLTAGNGMSNLAGSDPEDGAKGSGSNVRIISVAGLNGNVLKYNGSVLAANSLISNYNPSLLTITFTGGGSLSAGFTFVFIDNAGLPGLTPATYSITWASVLAVNLRSFDAVQAGKIVQLNWKTSNESSIVSYNVQRSADGALWKTISSQPATGSNNYSANDPAPLNGINYYRLQIMEQNGSVTYSGIRKVIFNENVRGVYAWPNPVIDQLNISADANSHAALLSTSGQTILETRLASGTGSMDMHRLPAGIYILRIQGADATISSLRIVKK